MFVTLNTNVVELKPFQNSKNVLKAGEMLYELEKVLIRHVNGNQEDSQPEEKVQYLWQLQTVLTMKPPSLFRDAITDLIPDQTLMKANILFCNSILQSIYNAIDHLRCMRYNTLKSGLCKDAVFAFLHNGCMHKTLSLMCKMSNGHSSEDDFEEGVDCDEMIVKRDEMIMEKKGRINKMERKLQEQDREIAKFKREQDPTRPDCQSLWPVEHFKNRKWLQWFENSEDNEKERERRKRERKAKKIEVGKTYETLKKQGLMCLDNYYLFVVIYSGSNFNKF